MINVGQYFSGAEKIFFNLLKIMEKTPSVIKVFCSKNILSHAPQAGNKTDIEGANKPQDLVRALFKTLWQYRWLSKRKVTIILNNKRALLLSPFIKIICGSSARTIFYEHGFQRNVYKKTMVELIIFLFCDSCITVSCATKKEHWHINQRKISQIYNGLPDLPKEEDNPTPEIVKHSDPGAYKIAYVSAFRTWKGQLDFLKIFSKLSQKNYTLYYIGGAEDSVSEKYYDEVKAEVIKLSLTDKVKFLGWVENVDTMLDQFDFIAQFSSEADPLPTSIIEAFRLGVPVIGSDLGGIPEMVDNHKNGVILPFNETTDKNAEILSDFLMNADIDTLAINAREKYLSRFNALVYADKVKEEILKCS